MIIAFACSKTRITLLLCTFAANHRPGFSLSNGRSSLHLRRESGHSASPVYPLDPKLCQISVPLAAVPRGSLRFAVSGRRQSRHVAFSRFLQRKNQSVLANGEANSLRWRAAEELH